MARYSKRISEKIEKTKGSAAPPQKKAGRDILLIVLIVINIVFLIIGWPQLANIDRGIYILLEGALISIYAQRHADLSEKYSEYVKYLSFIFMGLAFLLFIYSAYMRYIAS
ncbi:hypothetical protein [Pectinatus haikarae]|uniref:Uncharacterized protein n=1 Tax=Pectinatus haikarae TaxID=349096 RepID=A0ABT9YA29_9FIRM|nr:hypothetical protein [Pectinatus haikarae]MDQ0204694.1 hypothetical protein [Pectinatus haikarae]